MNERMKNENRIIKDRKRDNEDTFCTKRMRYKVNLHIGKKKLFILLKVLELVTHELSFFFYEHHCEKFKFSRKAVTRKLNIILTISGQLIRVA